MNDEPPVFPVALRLAGRHCLVVGGGTVAERKVDALLAAGARVTVVAPAMTDGLSARARDHETLTLRERPYARLDLDGVALVFTATGDRDVDGAVSADAEARHLFVNSADDPERCSFFLTAVVHRDPVVVSISTSGASPALASYLRRRIDEDLEPALGDVARVLGAVRSELHARGVSTETLDWSSVITNDLVELVARGHDDDATQLVLEALR